MINVAIKEGWAEGPWHTKLLSESIQAAGYSISEPKHADVLIGHSSACFDIDLKSPIRRYIFIDPPYWPGKTIFSCLLQKSRYDYSLSRFAVGFKYAAKKTAQEISYIFQKPNYTLLAYKNFGNLNFLTTLKDKQIIIVRNQDDYWCSKDIQVAISSHPKAYYVELPGDHNDFLINPQPYIDLLPEALL